ncbi:MAG: hypothetical protein JJT82_07805 [Legionellaceae bacterium]|nr:hypothetical protein [Legionellaceae bacterium]
MDTDNKNILVYLILGLLSGSFLALLTWQQLTSIYLYTVPLLFALFFALAFNGKQTLRLLWSSAALALILGSPLLALSKSQHHGLESMLWILPIACYVAHAFHYAIHLDSSLKPSYQSLFFAVWNTIPLLLVAGLFSLIGVSLLYLTALIFYSLQYNAFGDFIVNNSYFVLISRTTLVFTGLGIAKQNLPLMNNLRLVLLRVIYYLYPFLALISLLYLILFTAHYIGDAQKSDATGMVLLSLVSLGIIFFNAIFQEGKSDIYPSKTMLFFLKLYRISLLPLGLIMAFELWSPERSANFLLIISLLTLYSISYCLSVFSGKSRATKAIQAANISIALFFVFVFLLINNPLYPMAP